MLRANKFVYEQHVTYIFISIPIGQLWASHNGSKHALFSLKGQSSCELLRQKTTPVGTTDIGNLVRKSGFTRNLPMNMIRYYLTNNCVPLRIKTGLNHSDATIFLNWKYFLLWSEKHNRIVCIFHLWISCRTSVTTPQMHSDTHSDSCRWVSHHWISFHFPFVVFPVLVVFLLLQHVRIHCIAVLLSYAASFSSERVANLSDLCRLIFHLRNTLRGHFIS